MKKPNLSKNELCRLLNKSNMLINAWMKATIITSAELYICNPNNDLFTNSEMFTESTIEHIMNVAKIRIEHIKKKVDEILYLKDGVKQDNISISEVEKQIDDMLKVFENKRPIPKVTKEDADKAQKIFKDEVKNAENNK